MDEDTVRIAEQATLGSLLLDTGSIDHVRGWLRAGDFADTWHGQVYAVLLERRTAGLPIDVPTVAQAMVDRLGERLGGRLQLVDLLHATPGSPAPSLYARMVVEAGLRREIAGQGVLLRAGALQSAMAENAGPLASACLMVDATMEAIAGRWADANGHPRPSPSAPIPLRPLARPLELRADADKFLTDRPARDPGAERDHVIGLIGCLLAHPDAIPGVASWLRPAQVTDPGWRAVYAAACDLAASDAPVDPVTVAWAIAPVRAGGLPVPSPRQLREAADQGWLDHPRSAARLVAGEQVCALAERASTQLMTAAADPALEIGGLVDTAALFTAALRHVGRGLARETAASGMAAERPHLHQGPVAG